MLRVTAALVLLTWPSLAEADVIAFQGFEGTFVDGAFLPADASYSPTPEAAGAPTEPYGDGSGDTFNVVESLTTFIEPDNGQFWGMRRGLPNGIAQPQTLLFPELDLRSYRNVEVSFRWAAHSLEDVDALSYSVNSTPTTFYRGTFGGESTGWRLETVQIDDSVESLAFALSASTTGTFDLAAFDSVAVTGDFDAAAAVPEPSTYFLLGVAGAGGLALRRRRTNLVGPAMADA